MTTSRFVPLTLAALFLIGAPRLRAEEEGPPPFKPAVPGFNYDLQDHGIAVKRGGFQFMVTAPDPEDNHEKIYATFASGLSGFMLVELDTVNGECHQYNVPKAVAPWGLAVTPENDLLLSTPSGEIYRFDARHNTIKQVAKAGEGLYAMERAEDGNYYLGSVPSGTLYRFDPRTNALTNLGVLAIGQTYLHNVVAGKHGYLYCPVGSLRAQIVAYNLRTKEHREILPPEEAVPGFVVQIQRDRDGSVYARSKPGNYYRLRDGKAWRLAGKAEAKAKTVLEDFNVPRLKDGSRVVYQDPDRVRIGDGPHVRVLDLKYEGEGSTIFRVGDGPDGVYGSTLLPLYLFRHRPEKNLIENLGRGASDNGEIYSFARVGEKLFYSTYPSALLMQYDPAVAWNRTPDWAGNPKQLAELGPGHVRPAVMAADSQNRIWFGGLPAYGTFHGGLACYDTASGKIEKFLPVIPNQSIFSIAPSPDGQTVYCGTTVERGSGTQPVEKEAVLFAWDVAARKVLWQTAPVPGASGIANLIYRDGRLYGASEGVASFFVFNLATQKVEKSTPSWFGPVRKQSMSLGPDGNIYGVTWMSLFRFRPGGEVEELQRYHGDNVKPYGGSLFHQGAVIRDGRLYFAWTTHLMSMKLPLETTFGVH